MPTEQSKDTNSRDAPEQIAKIPIELIHPFKNHPFKVMDDELMQDTIDSITRVGILNPTIVRPDSLGGYEMISGHRRLHVASLLGMHTVPAIVRDLDDDEAVLLMVDSNIQRENLLPSERAKAYKMKLEALKRKAGRPSLKNVSQNGTHLRADQLLAEETGKSRNQIQRFVRLTALKPELLDMVDNKELALTPAVEISYLSEEQQDMFIDAMDYSQNTPSLSQAQSIRKLCSLGTCSQEDMYSIMSEEKNVSKTEDVVLKGDKVRKYFPRNYTTPKIVKDIYAMLEERKKNKKRDLER